MKIKKGCYNYLYEILDNDGRVIVINKNEIWKLIFKLIKIYVKEVI